jgi:hypothetical protein
MRIDLQVDDDGNPFLELLSEEDVMHPSVESQLLENFIRMAREKGLVIVNETNMNSRNDYASIRIKDSK